MRVCTKGFLSANGLKGNYGNKYSGIVLLLLKKRRQVKSGADPHPTNSQANCPPSPEGRLFTFSILLTVIYSEKMISKKAGTVIRAGLGFSAPDGARF